MITDFDVAAESGVVGEDDTVADDAVVSDVGVGEEIAIGADAGDRRVGGGAVEGDEFAEGVAVADLERGGFARVFKILGLLAD